MNVMIWVWLMSEIAAKSWLNIYRSVRGLDLVKARMYAGLIHCCSIYIMKYDVWSCSWVWLLLQSSVVCSVFWWLCCWQGFSVSVIQRLMMLVLSFVLQWYWWVQYENWMKHGLQTIVLCFRSIQSENVWNVVPGGWKEIVGWRLHQLVQEQRGW